MKILAIDIGGTFLKYALAGENGELIEKGKLPTPQESREALVEAVGGLWDRYSLLGAKAIAVSMPGIIDSKQGYVRIGGVLEYNNASFFRAELEQRCPAAEIAIFNDAKCAAQAEASCGALRDVQDGAVLLFGTMIGGGIVLGGKVRHGIHFSAGEVSYIVTDRAAAPDYGTVWGNRCSFLRLLRLYAEKKGVDAAALDGETVFAAVNSGEREAKEALDEYTREIAVQIFNLQTVLDVERFAVGGGISAQSAFLESIKKQMDALYDASPFFVPKAEIVPCVYGSDANLVGAVLCRSADRENE